MNGDSTSSAGRKSSCDALTSLLGVKGALRLLPQGPTPKAHIVLKRDYPKGEDISDQTSTFARFSFIAGKKFTVNKGQPLLFAVACPTDRDGRTLLGDDNTFVLEADIMGSSEDKSIEDTGRLPEQEDCTTSGNIERLPPKARKSLVRKKAYASYLENEPPLSLGFPGYPLGPTTPRVYSTASVQTDLISVSEPTSLTPALTPSSLPAIPLLVDAEKSPFQLPSPVSADHAQESISDALGQTEGEETDDSSRAERSLSPMDLSSANSTPNTSPVPIIVELPKEDSTQLPQDEDSPATPVASSSSEELIPSTSTILPDPIVTTTDVVSTAEVLTGASQSLDGCLDEDIVPKTENFAASKGKEPIKELKDVPSGPRAMQTPRPSIQPSSSRSIEISPAIPACRPALVVPVPNRQSSVLSKVTEGLNDSQPPEPKAVAYISTGSTSNPLGIRPSSALTSSTHVPQKSLPTGPRSLTASMAPKKPVIVGSQWSAARSSSSSSQASSGNFSTLSNTSSLTTLPPSPVIPPIHRPAPTFVRATLSQILPYASPSPPPPPESEPPPPPPPLHEPTAPKWKRISTVADTSKSATIPKSTVAAPGSNGHLSSTKDDPKPAASATIVDSSLKRHHDEIKESVGSNDATQEQPSKKARTTPQKASTPVSATPHVSTGQHEVSTASSTIPKATTNVVAQKLPTPRTHPLPPKPTASGSSYRPPPPKRERSPEPPEPKRPPPRTNWPPTYPTAKAQLQSSEPGGDTSVEKIIFNNDGSQIALICGDQTLRIWENSLSEIARLSHNSSITSACWIGGRAGVMTLCADGMISTWTRNGKEWKFAKLFRVHDGGAGSSSADTPLCLAYRKDRIAVSMPSGVKVWLLISGTWQQQREIARSGVTVIKFVQDGTALIGGCRDGVLWYCEVPNGTLRVHTFLPKTSVTSIDVHPSGLYLLVGQEGGKANLVTLRSNESKGSVERIYTSEKLQSTTTLSFPAIFATNGQAVLYGTVNGCGLVWDRKKGAIVYGLKHPEDDPIQAAAAFDGPPGGAGGWMITGTKKGRLFWWPQPVAAAPGTSS
ncbi:hypothetical protein M413DRAFT_438701 [Hebeloma cylindrosporum]|uniref:Uncharacterized protein n=1 Tax=Hebeloma cylindrosporum TaxID=76867 RepID=A0A0C3CLD7_HEBCY|nr:hypothetical protein M413DRAFT_438701 [Hebeloma cylindrosporum h7]